MKQFILKFCLPVLGMIPDKLYLKFLFRMKMGYKLNLNNPQTFNEKLNWLKLYNHQPLLSRLVDKYEVKKIVADRIGEQYVVHNIGCWDAVESINFDILPNKFVLKCTHDSSGVIICRNKNEFDIKHAIRNLKNAYSTKLYTIYREWPYKNVAPRVIADQMLDDHTGRELNDYKFWCFNGKPKFMYCTVKAKRIFENFYDMEFNPVDINHGFERHVPEFEKPAAFDEMKELATKLSTGLPFVRIDFFYVDGKVYFGEYTFFDWGGMRPFTTYKQDLDLGRLIDLPPKKNVKK